MGSISYHNKWEHCFWRANELHHSHVEEEVQELPEGDSGQACQRCKNDFCMLYTKFHTRSSAITMVVCIRTEVIIFYCFFQAQANRNTRLKRILEETREADGESDIRERMQAVRLQLSDSIHNLHEVFSSRIFVAICRGFWDRLGQVNLTRSQEPYYLERFPSLSICAYASNQFLADCVEVSWEQEGEQDLVPRIWLCSWGKPALHI